MPHRPASEYPFYDLGTPIAVAHAGGNLAGVEKQNTMEAFDAAAKEGFAYLETDVAATIDDQPVLYHGQLKFGGLEKHLPPIQNIRAVSRHTFEEVERKLGVNVTLLEDLLTTFPDHRI